MTAKPVKPAKPVKAVVEPADDATPLARRGATAAGAARTARHAVTVDVPTPNIEDFGHQPIDEQGVTRLAQELCSPAWPRGTMNIFTLEGLLTSLLVLPVALRPGVWLPLVWKETGWRLPVALQGGERFQGFMDLLVSLMRRIDDGLLGETPSFLTVLDKPALKQHTNSPQLPLADWINGFGIPIGLSENFKAKPDSVVNRTLFAIAMLGNPSAARIYQGHKPPPSLHEAVLTLASLRTSRGPLGALATPPAGTGKRAK